MTDPTVYPIARSSAEMCGVFWGSHGCDLQQGHGGDVHICGLLDEDGVCSQFDGGGRVRFFDELRSEWGEWRGGWAPSA